MSFVSAEPVEPVQMSDEFDIRAPVAPRHDMRTSANHEVASRNSRAAAARTIVRVEVGAMLATRWLMCPAGGPAITSSRAVFMGGYRVRYNPGCRAAHVRPPCAPT